MDLSNLITFANQMPQAPKERGQNTMVPMWMFRREIEKFIPTFNAKEADPKKHRKIAWQVGNETNLINPPFGEYAHYAKVRLDADGKFLEYIDDHIEWSNGPIDMRTRLARPNAVTAPIMFLNGQYYVLWFWAWREATWDDRTNSVPSELTDRVEIEKYIASHRGAWYPSVPGGWANLGETIKQVAAREAKEEMAVRFLDHRQEWRTIQDRSNGQCLVSAGDTTFEFMEGVELTKDEGELVKGRFATPIANFYSEDGLVMAAVDTALRDLGLLSSSPVSEELRELAALCARNPGFDKALLNLARMKTK